MRALLGYTVLIWLLDQFLIPNVDPYYLQIIMYTGINIALAVSLNLINGFTGQFSIGHAGFMAVGAYASCLITTTLRDSHPTWMMTGSMSAVLIFIASLFAAGVAASIIGYLVGLPSLRLKGDYLAIVTLGFGEIIRVILLNMEVVGGARGMPNIPPLTTFGLLYTFVGFTVFFIWRFVGTRFGRACLSIREDEIAAQAMGVNPPVTKVRAFVIASFFAGIAGGFFAHFLRFVAPSVFDFNRSFEIVIMVVLGGMGSITGSIIAAIFLTVLREALRPLQEITRVDFRMVIYSLLLIILMLTRPNGLFGTKEWTHYFKRRAT